MVGAFHHYLTLDEHRMRACYNDDMELNAISDVLFPVPECPRRLTVLQREQAFGEKMTVRSALRHRGTHATVHGRDIDGTFERALEHYSQQGCVHLLYEVARRRRLHERLDY